MNAAKIHWFSCCLTGLAYCAMLLEWLRGMDVLTPALADIREDVIGIILSKSGQFLFLLCLLSWHLILLWIKRPRQNDCFPQRQKWRDVITPYKSAKVLLVFFVIAAYINAWTDFSQTGRSSWLLLGIDQSTNLLVLLVGIVVSQISRMLLPTSEKDCFSIRYSFLAFLVVLLAATNLAQSHIPHTYSYRSQTRWTGLWVNPNTFGVLMGVGVVTTVGLILVSIQSGWFRAGKVVFYGVATVLMSIGLLHSYSRGAWIGFACGLVYLCFRVMGVSRNPQSKAIRWIRRKAVHASVIACSLALVSFWHFQNTEDTVVRRAFSVRSLNDFSLRNRFAAYEGALKMMADKPVFGFGWNQPESVYMEYYRPIDVAEGMAIQVNDFFTLGTTLGLTALLCFIAYVGMSFISKVGSGIQDEMKGQSGYSEPGSDQTTLIQTTCHASVIVLLVGFFFDGGLFKVALAVPFWILLELGRVD
jgi:hypothetical protein